MEEEYQKQLIIEINHIFESGANELRVFNMVKAFIEKRYTPKENTAAFLCNGNCGMNYCDENGCIDRKRNLVDITDIK